MKEKINVKKRRQTADLEQVKQELKKSQAFLNSLIEQSPYACGFQMIKEISLR